MSELPEGIPAGEPAVPRPSASAIVLRRDGDGGWRPLLVVRSRRSRFMPGHLAFPGGMFEHSDGSLEDDGAWQRCAARELEEETGLSTGDATWYQAGERTTPPMFPVRFHTKFWVVEAPDDWTPPDEPPTGEVESFRWSAPGEIIDEWSVDRAQLPPPVLAMLRTLAEADGLGPEEVAARVREANDLEQRAARMEFVRGIWVVPQRTATLPPASHTNTWLAGGRSFVVIDPGSDEPEEHARLLEVFERRRALGHRVEAVVLTHHHRDHVAGARRAALDLDVPLRAHASVLVDFEDDPSGPERLPIEDGERLDLDGLTLRAIWTPGHAPGHLAFHVPERAVLIAGDLVSGISTILIDPVRGDMEAYLDSLARIARLDCRALLPGHGPPLPGKAVPKLIEHRRRREAQVLEQLSDRPAELATIATGAYPELPDIPTSLTAPQAFAHLLWLERRGEARRDDAAGARWSRAEAGPESSNENRS